MVQHCTQPDRRNRGTLKCKDTRAVSQAGKHHYGVSPHEVHTSAHKPYTLDEHIAQGAHSRASITEVQPEWGCNRWCPVKDGTKPNARHPSSRRVLQAASLGGAFVQAQKESAAQGMLKSVRQSQCETRNINSPRVRGKASKPGSLATHGSSPSIHCLH